MGDHFDATSQPPTEAGGQRRERQPPLQQWGAPPARHERRSGHVDRAREQTRERHLERARALEALRRIWRDRPLDDLHERARQIRALVAEPADAPLCVPLAHLRQRAGHDREAPGREVVEQHAGAVDVAVSRGTIAAQHLRRHVQRRAGEIRNGGLARQIALASGAEVHQQDAAAPIAHHVLRLDVAMQQAGRVHGGQRFTDVHADERRLARGEPALLLQDLFERPAFDELHPEPGVAVGARRAEHRHDTAVPDAREQPSFGGDDGRVRALLGLGDQLERDFAIELRIPGPVHRSVGSAADDFAQGQVRPDTARRQIDGAIELRRRMRAVETGNLRNHAQLVEQTARLGRRVRLGCRPVHRLAVGNRLCELVEKLSLVPHGSMKDESVRTARGGSRPLPYSDSAQPCRYSRRRRSLAAALLVTFIAAPS